MGKESMIWEELGAKLQKRALLLLQRELNKNKKNPDRKRLLVIKSAEYYEANKEAILARGRDYRRRNRDRILVQRREYYQSVVRPQRIKESLALEGSKCKKPSMKHPWRSDMSKPRLEGRL